MRIYFAGAGTCAEDFPALRDNKGSGVLLTFRPFPKARFARVCEYQYEEKCFLKGREIDTKKAKKAAKAAKKGK